MAKSFILFQKKYRHFWMVLYFAFYIPWFLWLNEFTPKRVDEVTMMYSRLDDFIEFNELFTIPYFLWFAFIAVGYVFLMLTNQKDFYGMCTFLYTGMTTCLIIYTLFPNGQELRINYETLGRENILIDAIKWLQAGDTPYNVFPSIHCLNSIGMNIALARNETCKKHKWIIVVATILTILICLSTVYLKQHSILDVFGAIILSIPLFFISYKVPWKKLLFRQKIAQ